MIENNSLQELIQQQINLVVNQEIQSKISDESWIAELEQKILSHVRMHITAKFSNLSSIPELVDAVKTNISVLFEQGLVPGIDSYVDNNRIVEAVDRAMSQLVDHTISELSVDVNWLKKVEDILNQNMARKLAEHLSLIDFDTLVVNHLEAAVGRWKEKLLKDFSTTGIKDAATKTELTLLPDAVVVENDLISNALIVEQNAEFKGSAKIQNLVVTGSINTDNSSWTELQNHIAKKTLDQINELWRHQLANQVLEIARTDGIDFDSVTVNGNPLVSGNTLNSAITETNIKKLSTLKDLTVAGETHLADTVSVLKKRVGINTQQPEMALGIWDDEVSVAIGKIRENEAYVGTTRLQKLSIGVNRQSYLDIDTKGLVRVKSLKVDQWRIDFDDKVPGHSGARGDIIFNTDPKPGTPFAWQCLGGFQWQAIRGAQ